MTPGQWMRRRLLRSTCVALFAVLPVVGCSNTPTQNVVTPPPPPPPLPPPPPPVPTTPPVDGWTVILERPLGSKYEGISFVDSLHGWVIADRGEILATTDGGANWTLQASALGALRSIDFLDRNRGFAGSLTGKLYRTTNGGETWTDIASTLPATVVGFCGIAHVGERVHVVGRYQGAADYFRSLDGGNTWSYQNLGTQANGLVDVVFVSEMVGFISGMAPNPVARNGEPVILKTTDGGNTWREVFRGEGGPGWAWKVFPVSATTIYTSLEEGDGNYRVAKSTDGGETWTNKIVATGRPANVSAGLQGIGFLDENRGWVGGFFNGMYKTVDGGESWTLVPVTSRNINRFRRMGSTLFTAGTKGFMRFEGTP